MIGRANNKTFFYIIDGITPANADKLKIALESVDIIRNIKIDLQRGVLEITAKKNPEVQVKMACSIVQCNLRTEIKKRQI